MPVVGGTPRRLGNIVGDDAVFSPDGTRIAYLMQEGIYVCTRAGADRRKLASLPGDKMDLAWSPDGKVLRFRAQDPKTFSSTFWEVSSDGLNLHPLLPSWRQSRPDGTSRVQLAAEFSEVLGPRWSPDGTRIVFNANKKDRPHNIYAVRAEGGAVEELLPEDVIHVYPDWAPDGRSIAYSTALDKNVAPPADGAIYVLDLQTRETKKVPGSDGLEYPRWSPDGKHLAALSENSEKAMLFNFQTRQWREMAHGHLLSGLSWSKDGKYLYFEDILEPKEPVYRMRTGDAHLERWTDFDSVLQSGVARCQFTGLAPDGSVLAIAWRGSPEIYSLDLDLP